MYLVAQNTKDHLLSIKQIHLSYDILKFEFFLLLRRTRNPPPEGRVIGILTGETYTQQPYGIKAAQRVSVAGDRTAG